MIPVAEVPLRLVDDDLLVARPVALLDGGVEVVEPPLAALLADAARQLLAHTDTKLKD